MALRLGDILVERGLLTPQQLAAAVEEQEQSHQLLGQVLLRMDLIKEKDLLQTVADQQGISFLDLKDIVIPKEAVEALPSKFAWHYKIMPIRYHNKCLTIALSNPFEMWLIEDLETHLGFRVEKVLSTQASILEAMKKYYGVGGDTVEKILSQDHKNEAVSRYEARAQSVNDLEKNPEDVTVIRLVNQIFQEAIAQRATDIHFEVFRGDLMIRYRIDGILYDIQVMDHIKFLYSAIISRIKIMSGLDIIERRLPQDGRAKVKIDPKEYELRVSVMPTLYGENIVVRILPTTMLFDIRGLGMCPRDLKMLEVLILKSHGIVFLTGPTGSGKTTTLYACLSRLNSRQQKIVTIEDPVEYELRGIAQTQINSKIGLTFATVLRSMLRHDPDVMMVGEVRDFETAEITIQTALTGHLVFSTIHTNDAASGATRLIDIGIEPYLAASSVEAFIAQRLVRLICGHCKEEKKIDDLRPDLKEMARKSGAAKIYHGRGCKQCAQTGYMGRTGIYEILVMTDEIKKLVSQKVTSDVIKARAVELGMRLLKEDGWEKIATGLTTPEEVLRVTQ